MNENMLPIFLLVGLVLLIVLWDARSRPRNRPRQPQRRSAHPVPPVSVSSAAVLPAEGASSAPPISAPSAVAPPAPLLDPNDPLVRRCAEIEAQFASTSAAIDALPRSLSDHVAMRAVVMAAQSELTDIRRALPAGSLKSQSVLFRQLNQLDRQFVSVRADAQLISVSYADYAQLLEQLRA